MPVFTWCDVRDVALAHVRAMTIPDAGGKRFYVVGGHFTNTRIADIVCRFHPQLVKEGRVRRVERVIKKPIASGNESSTGGSDIMDVELVGDDLPTDVYQFDNSRSRTLLGLVYRDLETTIRDTVSSMLERLPPNPQ